MPEPIYYLAAAPMEKVEVPTLTRTHGVRELLEHPPAGRHSGWNLTTLERAELRPGPRLHIQNGERKFIDLSEDGTFTVIGVFDGFLGVGRWDFNVKPLVNGLAVVEYTYEFVSLYERLLDEFIEPRPAWVRFTAGVRNAHYTAADQPRKLLMVPGPVNDHYGWPAFDAREAPESEFGYSIDVQTSAEAPHIDTKKLTYDLARRFYNSFGLTDDDVPYVSETQDSIDVAQIYEMHG